MESENNATLIDTLSLILAVSTANLQSSSYFLLYLIKIVIGASLSEPHTSVTALRTWVCMYVCLSVCGHIPKILNERVNFNITKIELGV